jgi:hypothetical protein
MGRLDETVSGQFAKWEMRGRGWQVWPYPVPPEPPFRPFRFQLPRPNPEIDDGRKPTFLSSIFSGIEKTLNPKPPVLSEEPEVEPEPDILQREPLVELRAMLPSDLDIPEKAFAAFLRQLSLCKEPIAFELLGTAKGVTVQFAAHTDDVSLLHRQLNAYFPEAAFVTGENGLELEWDSCEGDDMLIVEFGLAREFLFPLAGGKLDSFIGIVAALTGLRPEETALFQVLFQSAQKPWAESIVRSTTTNDRKPLFVNMPELTKAAEAKASQPLFAAVVRIALRTPDEDRTLQIARELAASLSAFAAPQGNELIPLRNDDYPFEQHVEDMLRRQSRRSGMLLTSDELIGFVHLPSSAIRSPALMRQMGKTKPAPAIVRQPTGVLLGENEHSAESGQVRLTSEQRTRHIHIIGASGTGKSTLLFNLIRQDIENGQGVAVLDPHGDLIDRICGIIPRERIDDVVLVDPSDPEYSVGFNILSAHSELERNLLASDLVAVFERLSTSWGDQMNSILQNAILAFLENDRPGTIADLRRFLIEKPFRNDFLKSVRDSEVVYYWEKSFPHLPTSSKSIGSILTRLDTFLAKKPIRLMVSQSENKLDFANVMDSGKIFLAKLPEGLLGKENSHLLGTVLISKFQQIAMSRQAQQVSSRRDFWLYIDEFANFITPSMAEILSGARKYRLGLTLAHHELHQLERNKDVASAVMSHPYTRVVFRVGDDDAKKLADGFSYFEAKDLRNLPAGQAVCRVERSDFDFNLAVPLPEAVDIGPAEAKRTEVITASRRKYAMARADVEALLAKSRDATPALPEEQPKPPVAKPSPQHESPAAAAPGPPQTADAPVATVSEKKIPERPDQPDQGQKPGKSEPTPGRGGALHKLWQDELKAHAEALNFLATIECEVPGGSVDVLLKRGDVTIACEISVTSPIASEVNHIVGRLKAGISKIAVVSESSQRLRHIRAAAVERLSKDEAKRVSYYEPEQFLKFLEELAAAAPIKAALPGDSTVVRRGRTIKRAISTRSQSQTEQRENEILRTLTEAMRRRKKSS